MTFCESRSLYDVPLCDTDAMDAARAAAVARYAFWLGAAAEDVG
jgi:hypothetical protein